MNSSGPVNVASVPQRSPFRYPGGKTWLVPTFRVWMQQQPRWPALLVEPFAGGASIGLTAAFEDLADRVLLVEIDPDVAAVWQTLLSDDNAWLAAAVLNFDLTPENLQAALVRASASIRDRALATLLRNRVGHGGILAPGAGRIRSGENGKGLASRWYPQTLASRIAAIGHLRHRLDFRAGDAFVVLDELAHRPDVAWFIDPPYHQAGRRLYTYHQIDHERLFEQVKQLKGPFLLTYDDSPEIGALACRYGFRVRRVPMRTTHHRPKFELLIEAAS